VDHYETVRLTKDGRRVDVSLTVSPITDATGMIIGASAIARDITRRKQGDLELRRSEARLRALVDSAVDGIIVIDDHGHIEAFNAAAERLFGYAANEVMGHNVNILMPPPYHAEHDQYLARYLATGVPRIIGLGREVTGRRKDESTFPVHLSVGEMSVGRERKFTGIVHDLTARTRMEEQLREQATLVRLGEMAAVIAHEVRNPLAAIRGAIQVLGRRLAADSREAAVMTEIIARIDALNQLVKDLLLFARPPQPRPTAVDVAALVITTASLLREDAAHSEVRVEVSGVVPPVMADAELLKIVVLNLLINSAQAMRGKGVIHVSVTSVDSSCHIAIIDSGPGIPLEIRGKLFTPFVTTKSRGTGLGLPTVKRLVEAQQGAIHVESPPGGGTTMTVRLPLAISTESA
jgi:two-component system sensor kinase FixL